MIAKVTAAAAARIDTMAANEFMALPSALETAPAFFFEVRDRRRDEITHPLSKRRKEEKLLRCTQKSVANWGDAGGSSYKRMLNIATAPQ